jgi:RimJ/RimL family protein N-acetyltransferase
MELHTAALFHHDEAGRITGTNDGNPPGIAPRLYLGRTRNGNVWRFRDEVPDDLAAKLTSILEVEPIAYDLRQPPASLSFLRELLERAEPEDTVDLGPAFTFPATIQEAVGVAKIDEANVQIVRAHFPDHYPWLADEFPIRQPITAIIRDGVAVSICYSARLTSEAAEAGVDTATAHRGQGFAVLVVSAWASAIRRTGRIPLYSTSWENLASQRVATKLGLVPYGSDLSIG